MIKEVFYVCTAVSLFSYTLGLLLKSARNERIAKVLQTVIDIIVLYIIVSGVVGTKVPDVDFPNWDSNEFTDAQNETAKEIVIQAENLLEQEICEIIENEIGKVPSKCVAEIDGESFELSKLTVYFKENDATVSGYSVKRILSDKYKVNAEVIFE